MVIRGADVLGFRDVREELGILIIQWVNKEQGVRNDCDLSVTSNDYNINENRSVRGVLYRNKH